MNQLAPRLAFGGACNEIEAINVRTLGGPDTITVNDLTGTDVPDVSVDLISSSVQRESGSPYDHRSWTRHGP